MKLIMITIADFRPMNSYLKCAPRYDYYDWDFTW